MLSIIITTRRESQTLPKAVQTILNQNLNEEYEVLIVGPDEDTERVVKNFQQEFPRVKYLKDRGVGKPAALNLAFEQARGQILILTDGDVWVENGALNYLLKPFSDDKVGAVSGRPISINPRNKLFGYWSHFLTDAAHQMRIKKKVWPCSGYLYALRSGLIKKIPENSLSEDAIITQEIREQGYKIIYAPEAKVFVKYPDNFRDWVLQKKRAAGGYTQKIKNQKLKIKNQMRSFGQEVGEGIKLFFTYPKNLKEFWWTKLLYLARIYLWLTIFWQIKFLKKPFAEVWQRVESTK